MTRKQRARPTRLPRWQEVAVYVTLGALILSGLAWLALDQWVRINGEFGQEHHPAEHGALVVHGVVAYGFLIVAGAMIPVHIKLGWSLGRNKASGLSLAIGCMIGALTALALYYLGDERGRSVVSLVHWLVGLLVIPALLIHASRGRRGT